MTTATPFRADDDAEVPTGERTGFRHEALLWDDLPTFLARGATFLGEAVAAGAPAMAALRTGRWEQLREVLGPDAAHIRHVDLDDEGRNPRRLLAAWLDLAREHPGAALRGLTEPVWQDRRPAEVDECHRHEALLNVAVPTDLPLELVCAYDVTALDGTVVDEARRTHPVVDDGASRRTSADFAGAEHALLASGPALDPAPDAVESWPFRSGELHALRRVAASYAASAGLDAARTQHLTLVLSELGSNSIDHGGGSGVLRAWAQPDALVFEVEDRGHLTDPLAGQLTPDPHQPRGRGLWLVNRLSDLVQVRTSTLGTVVRVTTWLDASR